jgi:hypothetical protein
MGNKKEKLILGQKGEPKEQMTFDDESRPNRDVEDDLTSKETPYSNKVKFPERPEGEGSYEELLASEEYKHALDKLAQYTGERNIGTGVEGKYAQLSNQAMRILSELMRAETAHEEELEQLAERVIREYFKIPEGAIQFNLKLVKEAVKVNGKQKKEELQQKEEELVDDLNDLTPDRAKRRLINAMTQGHAVNGNFMFDTVSNELVQITGVQNIVEKYSIFVATMMLGYWQFPNQMIAATGGGGDDEGQGSGVSKVDTSTNPPTVNAQAIIFPFLIHETIKGVMEFLSRERNPENEERSQKARDLEDNIQHETWDIRLGPAIWRKLVKLFPDSVINDDDKKMLQSYIFSNIANLPVREFLMLMKEVMVGDELGQNLIGAMYYDLSRMVQGEETTGESEFKRLMDQLTEDLPDEEMDNDELNDLLNGMGITLN